MTAFTQYAAKLYVPNIQCTTSLLANYIRLWTLADNIRMPRLNNYIMNILVERRNKGRDSLFRKLYDDEVVSRMDVFNMLDIYLRMPDLTFHICVGQRHFDKLFTGDAKRMEKTSWSTWSQNMQD